MKDEPRKHPWLMVLVFGSALGTVPFAFVGRPTKFLAGLPVWLWTSIGFTVLLGSLTAFAMLRYWKDETDA